MQAILPYRVPYLTAPLMKMFLSELATVQYCSVSHIQGCIQNIGHRGKMKIFEIWGGGGQWYECVKEV